MQTANDKDVSEDQLKSGDEKVGADHKLQAEHSSERQAKSSDPSVEEQTTEEENQLLNYSKDLFESTKIKKLSDEDVNKTFKDGVVEQLDKSDATWSDDELFEEDSFIIKATQLPETIKSFNSPVFGIKRKQFEDSNVSSKTKSPRYSCQLDVKTDLNSSKLKNVQTKTKDSAIKMRSAAAGSVFVGKPPLYPSAGPGSVSTSKRSLNLTKKSNLQKNKLDQNSAINVHQNNVQTHNVSKQNSCATDPPSCAIIPRCKSTLKLGTSETSAGNSCVQTRSVTYSSKSQSGSEKCTSGLCLTVSGLKTSTGSDKVSPNTPFSSEVKMVNQKFSSFKKHNSFNGSENVKFVTPVLSRQRSYSGNNTVSCEYASISKQIPVESKIINNNNTSNPALQSNTVKNFANFVKTSNTDINGNKFNAGSTSVTSLTTSFRLAPSSNKPVLDTVSDIASETSSKAGTCANLLSVANACTSGVTATVTSTGRKSSALSLKKSANTAVYVTAEKSSRLESHIVTSSALQITSVTSACAPIGFKHSNSVTSIGFTGTKVSSNRTNLSFAFGNSVTKTSTYVPGKANSVEIVEEPMKESPVFVAKKRLSAGAFDTSLSDDILCQLAEPDDLLDSQVCDTTVKHESRQSFCVNTKSSMHSSSYSHIPVVAKITTNTAAPLIEPKSVAPQAKSLMKQNYGDIKTYNVPSKVLSSKADEPKTYTFKSSQKPKSNNMCQEVQNKQKAKYECSSVTSAVFREPFKNPEKSAVVAKISVPGLFILQGPLLQSAVSITVYKFT